MRRDRISENLHPQQQPQAPRMNPWLLILLPDLDKPSLIRHLQNQNRGFHDGARATRLEAAPLLPFP